MIAVSLMISCGGQKNEVKDKKSPEVAAPVVESPLKEKVEDPEPEAVQAPGGAPEVQAPKPEPLSGEAPASFIAPEPEYQKFVDVDFDAGLPETDVTASQPAQQEVSFEVIFDYFRTLKDQQDFYLVYDYGTSIERAEQFVESKLNFEDFKIVHNYVRSLKDSNGLSLYFGHEAVDRAEAFMTKGLDFEQWRTFNTYLLSLRDKLDGQNWSPRFALAKSEDFVRQNLDLDSVVETQEYLASLRNQCNGVQLFEGLSSLYLTEDVLMDSNFNLAVFKEQIRFFSNLRTRRGDNWLYQGRDAVQMALDAMSVSVFVD